MLRESMGRKIQSMPCEDSSQLRMQSQAEVDLRDLIYRTSDDNHTASGGDARQFRWSYDPESHATRGPASLGNVASNHFRRTPQPQPFS